MKQDVLISIFIPVFNGEKYLEETLLTIKHQTYKNIEILLVDDSSIDGSLNILNNFARQDSRFKVYEKTNGGMTALSWNFILPKITGDFIFYSSQDDLFSEDLVEKMVKKQKETNADTILPDVEFYFSDKQDSKKIIGLNGNRKIVLNGRQACIESLTWNIHGFTLSAKKLYENEFFPEDAFDSDEFITRKILFKSNKVVFSEGIFFYRQDNPDAITKNITKKNFYVLNTLKRVSDFLEENKFDQKIVTLAQFNLYRKLIKYTALYKIFRFDYKKDKEEIRTFLKQFKERNCTSNLIFRAIKFSEGRLGFKLRILYLIYTISFLYKIAVWVEIVRLKANNNIPKW
jgi:glycosyltransferase involved in cell wall biosynthesis